MEYLNAFIIGGLICAVGQVIMDTTKLNPAHILVIFLTSGVVLTAIGVYEPIVKIGGAGATVPLPGFGYTLANGAIEGAKENGIIGAFTGGIESAAGGIAAATFFGYIMSVIFSPKTKE